MLFDETDDPDPPPGYDQVDRIDAILGDKGDDHEAALDALAAHFQANLKLPCQVTGREDFRWEEPYVLGELSPREYKELKKSQPSYTDLFELLGVDRDGGSIWMLFGEDICAHVRRISDGKVFVLGLAELEVIDEKSPNHQLLHDYALWFVNAG